MLDALLARPESISDREPDLAGGAGTIEVRTFFRGVGLQARLLPDPRARSRNAARRRAGFLIGSAPDVDAPCDAACVPVPSFPLVSARHGAYVVGTTPEMRGEVTIGEQRHPLRAVVEARGATFALPPGAQARLECGATTFLVRATARPAPIPAPLFTWSRRELRYTLASALALLLFLGVLFVVPPDARSLSLDVFDRQGGLVKVLIKPPVAPEEPALEAATSAPGGTRGQSHRGDPGKMGSETSRNPRGRVAIAGPPDSKDLHLAKARAAARAASAGILGILNRQQGSLVSSILGRDTALGPDTEDVLGNLVGAPIAEAYAVGGLGPVGSGRFGGGTGEATLGGDPRLGTIGVGSGKDSGYGRCVGTRCGTGALGTRKTTVPDMIRGQIEVRGILDKEIVRRIVRRHLNEVRYCYAQELARSPELAGRIVVQFTISGMGQVLSSVLQSSSMGNARVESCTVQAVRRWEFPQPRGGGLVIVSYPFLLVPTGSS